MSKRRKGENRWGDVDGGSAFVIPWTTLRHPNFTRLSPFGNKLVMDLARQFSGFNNGYLCSAWSLMKDRGWNSSHTLHDAILEVEHYNLMIRTQHGNLNKPSLHAFTWLRIDEKPGKNLEVRPTLAPPATWKIEQPTFVKPERKHRKKTKLGIRRAA